LQSQQAAIPTVTALHFLIVGYGPVAFFLVPQARLDGTGPSVTAKQSADYTKGVCFRQGKLCGHDPATIARIGKKT
jgi:hypothetical protein